MSSGKGIIVRCTPLIISKLQRSAIYTWVIAPVQLVFLRNLRQIGHDRFSHSLVLYLRLEQGHICRRSITARDLVDQCGCLDGIQHRDCDETGSSGISMHQQGSEQRIKGEDALQLFQGDILSLSQLDDILDPVHNLQTAKLIDLSDAVSQSVFSLNILSGMQPSFLVQGLLGIHFVVQITRENIIAFE